MAGVSLKLYATNTHKKLFPIRDGWTDKLILNKAITLTPILGNIFICFNVTIPIISLFNSFIASLNKCTSCMECKVKYKV